MSPAARQRVRERAGDRCEYCDLPQSATPFARFHIEHVVASQHGGTNDEANLALACDRCNLFKGPNLTAIDPDTDVVVMLYNPRQDRWATHFAVVDATIVGQTAIGRATARLLNMNAPRRVALRRELTSS